MRKTRLLSPDEIKQLLVCPCMKPRQAEQVFGLNRNRLYALMGDGTLPLQADRRESSYSDIGPSHIDRSDDRGGMTVCDNVGDTDFDTCATWERSPMILAKRSLNELGAAWEPIGHGWLKIHLGAAGALFFAPGTGNLRFEKGRIFSSKGLSLALAIVRAHLN